MSATAEKPALPGSLHVNRMLDRWIRFNADGTVSVQVAMVGAPPYVPTVRERPVPYRARSPRR